MTNSTDDAQPAITPHAALPLPEVAHIGAPVTHLDKVQVISLSGEFDVTSRGLLEAGLESLSGMAVADLSAVIFIDSTALGVLISTTRHLRAAGGDLILVVASSQVQRVLAVTQLDRYFSVFVDLPSAITAAAARLLPASVGGGEDGANGEG